MQRKLRKGYTSPVLLIGKINKKKKPIECTYTGTVKFYRSKAQSLGKLGKEDSEYNGEFGFDLYNKEHCPKKSFIYYYGIDGKLLENQSGEEFNGYVCPYMSIWPPKIDKNKSSVTLYVKANSARNEDANVPEFLDYECYEWNINTKSFSSASSKLKISKIKTETNDFKIKIDCIEPFENDISIVAKCGSNIVGRIIVKANAKVYETIIQPVLVSFGNSPSTSIGTKDHEKFVTELVGFFSNQAFNQAYIKGKLSDKTHVITLQSSGFNNIIEFRSPPEAEKQNNPNIKDGKYIIGDKTGYNRKIEQGYANLVDKENLKRLVLKNQLKEVIKKIADFFKEDFKYGDKIDLKKSEIFYNDRIASKTWEKLNAIDNIHLIHKYNDLKKEYTGNVFLKKDNTTFLFYTNEIEGAYNGTEEELDSITQAFSLVESCTCHIFNNALGDEKSLKLIIHELGHSYSLRHTFSTEIKKEIEEKEKTIDKKEDELKKLEKEARFLELKKYFGISRIYKEIYESIQIEDDKIKNIDPEDFDSYFMSFFTGNYEVYIKGKRHTEIEENVILKIENKEINLPNEDLIKLKKEEIEKLKKELVKSKEKLLTDNISKSFTIENYLDYRQSNNGNTTKKFEYKSFFHWQWDYLFTFVNISESFNKIV